MLPLNAVAPVTSCLGLKLKLGLRLMLKLGLLHADVRAAADGWAEVWPTADATTAASWVAVIILTGSYWDGAEYDGKVGQSESGSRLPANLYSISRSV